MRESKDSNGKPARGIAFSEAEESTVKRINDASERAHDARLEIGKLVDGLVAVKGGTKYGESTLDRLAKHPALECSREQLRRCWQYYRLLARYGKELQKTAPTLQYSHLYQLSRLLDIEDEKVQHEALVAMVKKASDEHMTVTALANSVSTHLASLGKSIRGKPAADDAAKGTKNNAETDAYNALVDTSETVVIATQNIADKPEIGRVAELKLAANRLGFSYVQLVIKLMSIGDEDAMADARKVVEALAAAVDTAANVERGAQHANK